MKFRSLHKWENVPALPGLIFFVQRMEELLFDYSLDSYKAPTLNTPFLIRETILIIEETESEIIDKAHLKHVLGELILCIQNDFVAKTLMSFDRSKYFNSENPDLKELKLRLEILFSELSPLKYLEKTCELLKEAVKDGKKSRINYLAMTYATTLLNLGFSKKHIYDKLLSYFYYSANSKIQSFADLDKFLEELTPYSHDFTVYFKISGLIFNITQESLKKFSLEIIDTLPPEVETYAASTGFILSSNEKFIVVKKIPSLEPIAAMQEAEKRLGTLCDLFLLYSHKKHISWSHRAIVKQCCTDELKIATRPKNVIENGFDLRPEAASKRLNYLLENFNFNTKTMDRFNRVVDLHGMSISTDNTESQILNLWSALETMVPSKTTRNKVNNVIEMIMPFLLLNYSRRLIERFGYDLFNWNHKEAKLAVKDIPNTHGLKFHQKCLFLLGLPENEDKLNNLYLQLGDFHLLRYRAYQLNKVLASPEKYLTFLMAHEQRVSWQIRRIYRTRNLIVHSSKSAPGIRSLVENAHDYLDQTFSIVSMLSCREKDFSTFEQAFEYVAIKYSVFKSSLHNQAAFNKDNILDLYWAY